MVVPQAVAYTSLAGLPVESGLYVATVPMVAYALVGSSRPLSVSSTSTIAILTAGALADAGVAGDQGRAAATAAQLALLAVLLGLRRWARAVPGPLVVVVAGIALVALTGVEGRGVNLVGPVSGGAPTPELPGLAGSVALLPAASGIALMSFIESISAARAFAAKADPPVDANRELLALGAANLGAGLFRAFPSGGGTSQTAVNDAAGAATRLAGVVTAAVAVLALTVLAPPLADLPLAVLGAIILVSAIGLADLAELLHGQGMAVWAAVPRPQPLEVVRRAAELLGCTDLEADTGPLGVRIFRRLEDADAAYAGLTGDVRG